MGVVQLRRMGGQPAARYAFVDRVRLMRTLHVGEQASDMTKFLRELGFKSPNATTIERICYRGHLMRSDTALRWLRAFNQYAINHKIDVEEGFFDPDQALTDFGYRVVGLGSAIQRASGQPVNSEVNLVSDLAGAASLLPDTIDQMARGRCVLVPRRVAENVSLAATNILKLPEPLLVEYQPVNDTYYKPIGADRVEAGADAFKCSHTATLRRSLLDQVADLSRAA